VDGSHLFDAVRRDIEITRELLGAGGVAVFDDILDPHAPGVPAAVWAEVALGELIPLVLSDQKLYATWDASLARGLPDLANRLDAAAPRLRREEHQITGRPFLRIVEDDANSSPRTSAGASHLRRRWSPLHVFGERLNRVVATAVAPRFDALNDRLTSVESGLAGLQAATAALCQRVDEATLASQPLQRLLALRYRELQGAGSLPDLRDVGFRVYSQTDEDGILLHLFTLIGTRTKQCVEVAFGSPYGANTTNLLCNWGWTGLLIESSESQTRYTREFFGGHPDTSIFPPTVVNAWVTKENINALIAEHGFTGEIDLLSLDLDGMDWWIWKELEVIRPRVVVVEYQDIWGSERAVTAPYRADFVRQPGAPTEDHFGASLPAFVKLAHQKGYRLVGSNRYDYNAFFVADGVGEDVLPGVAVETCLAHPKVIRGQGDRLPRVADLEWIDV
jgi:hypothetical protein